MTVGKKNVEALNDVFRAVHTIKGNAGFFAHAALERACMELESSLDRSERRTQPRPRRSSRRRFARSTASGAYSTPSSYAKRPRKRTPRPRKRTPGLESGRRGLESGRRWREQRGISTDGEISSTWARSRRNTSMRRLPSRERPIGEILVQKGVVNPDAVAEALKIQHPVPPWKRPPRSSAARSA
jgi:hypothetical protein